MHLNTAETPGPQDTCCSTVTHGSLSVRAPREPASLVHGIMRAAVTRKSGSWGKGHLACLPPAVGGGGRGVPAAVNLNSQKQPVSSGTFCNSTSTPTPTPTSTSTPTDNGTCQSSGKMDLKGNFFQISCCCCKTLFLNQPSSSGCGHLGSEPSDAKPLYHSL